MANVYRNSFLTIAALSASNSGEALFAQRDPLAFKACWIYKTSRGKDIYVEPYLKQDLSFGEDGSRAQQYTKRVGCYKSA
jgi:hypothetical protein